MEFRNDKNMHWMLGGGADGDRETFATWNACILPTLSILKPIVWLFWREWSTENSKERLKYIYILKKKNPFSLSFKLYRNIKLQFDLIYLHSFCFTLLCNWGDNLSPKYPMHFYLFNFLFFFPYLGYRRVLWQSVILILLCSEWPQSSEWPQDSCATLYNFPCFK